MSVWQIITCKKGDNDLNYSDNPFLTLYSVKEDMVSLL